MKKISFKINRWLKHTLVALAIMGGAYAIPAKTVATSFASIGLVAAMKKKGITLEAAEEKLIGEIDAELGNALAEAKKGLLTQEQFDAKLEEKKASILEGVKSVKIGDSTLEEILRVQGEALAAAKAIVPEDKPLNVKQLIEAQMPAIQKMMQTKSGEIRLDIKAAANMTTANTIDEATFSIPAAIIESMTMREFVGKRYGRQYIGDIADRSTVANMEQYTTWLEEGSEQGAFAIVAEGALKPLVSTSLVRNFAAAKKIAGKYVVTEEFVKFRQNAYTIIRRLIMDKMIRDYDALLTADVNTAAAAYTGTVLDGTIANPNDYDAIGAVAAQIQSLNFEPDVIILNPQDAWRIRLNKDDVGRYQFPVVTQDGETRIFNLRLVTTTYQTAGYFTLAEAGLFKIEEEAITVRIGFGIDITTATVSATTVVVGVTSDFDNNRMRVIVETYFKDWLPTPYIGSVVRAQFSTVKTALLAAQV